MCFVGLGNLICDRPASKMFPFSPSLECSVQNRKVIITTSGNFVGARTIYLKRTDVNDIFVDMFSYVFTLNRTFNR